MLEGRGDGGAPGKPLEKTSNPLWRDCGLPATCSGLIFGTHVHGSIVHRQRMLSYHVQKALQCPFKGRFMESSLTVCALHVLIVNDGTCRAGLLLLHPCKLHVSSPLGIVLEFSVFQGTTEGDILWKEFFRSTGTLFLKSRARFCLHN